MSRKENNLHTAEVGTALKKLEGGEKA